MLYTMILDDRYYLLLAWDTQQLSSIVGDLHTAIHDRIDINHSPRSYENIYKVPLNISFPKTSKEDEKCTIPDLCIHYGRLFLNIKAYEVLYPLIKDDGEFLPLTYEGGEAFLFNPLRVAEDVNAVDDSLSKKNEWKEILHLAFHEERVKDWSLFRTKFNSYQTLQCQPYIKDAIENAGLKGLYITSDLGRIYPGEKSEAGDIN